MHKMVNSTVSSSSAGTSCTMLGKECPPEEGTWPVLTPTLDIQRQRLSDTFYRVVLLIFNLKFNNFSVFNCFENLVAMVSGAGGTT